MSIHKQPRATIGSQKTVPIAFRMKIDLNDERAKSDLIRYAEWKGGT